MPEEIDQERAAYDDLCGWSLSLRDPEFIHQHVVDAWAAQHADENTKPIAVTFALVGLYLHLEKGFNGREVQRAHMQLAQPRGRGPARKNWPRFEVPKRPANLRVRDVISSPDRVRAIDDWCRSVWEAWRPTVLQEIDSLTAGLRR